MVNFATCLIFIIATVTASPRKHIHGKRITNGYDTNIWEANYYVYFVCGNAVGGATIVSPTRVITAAHCVHECKPDQVTMHVGMNSRAEIDASTQYKADNFFMHPNYDSKGFNYDIAVVYVKGQIQTNGNVGTIPYGTSYPPVGGFVMCLGYGGTQSGQGAQKLQKTWNLIKSYDKNNMITDSEKTTAMSGDSGGPCIYDNKLAGVIVGAVFENDKPTINIEVNLASEEILNFVRSHVQ